VFVAAVEFGDVASIALGVELRHGGVGAVATVGCLPLVVHVGEHGADEADHGRFVGEDADDSRPALDLFLEPLEAGSSTRPSASAAVGRR
jgi:hypothetical protein